MATSSARTDAHAAADFSLAQTRYSFIAQGEDTGRVTQKKFSFGGWHNAAASALKQVPLQQALEPAHLHAQRRLGSAGLRGDPAQAALPADRHIGAKKVEADLLRYHIL